MPSARRKRQIRRLRKAVKRGTATEEQIQRFNRWTNQQPKEEETNGQEIN